VSLVPPRPQPLVARALVRPAMASLLGILLLAAAAVVSRISPVGLGAVGVALVGLIGYASFTWPRATIVLVVLSPILDRYLVAGILPPDLETASHFLSEGLLLTVTASLGLRAWRQRRLIAAVRHPVTWALVAFGLIGVVSAVVNGVPVRVAFIGLLFTLDATLLFFLPRLVEWSPRQTLLAVAAFIALMVAAALVALAQALLSPHLFGLSAVPGRFGEVYRLAAFIGDPNVFGTFMAAAAPFAVFAATSLVSGRRTVALTVAFLLIVALWLSFSRGAWLAWAIGALPVLAILSRRTLLLALAITGLALVTAIVMPRDLLGDSGADRPDLFDSTVGRFGEIGGGRDLRTLFVLNALPIIGDHPLVGVGPGRYGGAAADLFGTPVYAEYDTDELFIIPTQRTVDNFWLHLLVEMGIAGTAAFVAAALIPGVRVARAVGEATGARRILLGGVAVGAAALVVSSVSTMLLEANSVGFLFWFLLGIGEIVAATGLIVDRRAAP
jgi:O-antigen ligase